MAAQGERLLDLLEAWLDARDQGQSIPVEQLCADCPELMPDLRSHIAMHCRMDRLAEPCENPPPATNPAWTTPASPHPGQSAVAGYEILGALGEGGMGVVFKAREIALQRVVALKMIKAAGAGKADLQQLRSEAQALARLQHPNIVQVFEIGEHDGRPFLSLEFCSGGSLDHRLAGTPQPAREAAVLVETLARAIHAAHQANVIHRDLKPANVLLLPDGTPKITDFGLARKRDEVSQTEHGAIKGSPPYMAPEQAQGRTDEIGPAADVYALGATLYECLTGRPPFLAATVIETVLQVIGDEPVPPSRLNPSCPRDLETICLKCLHKQPASRYASARDLADDLRRYLDGKPILARPAGRAERLLKWARRSPFQAATAAAGAALLIAVMAALLGYAELRHRELVERDRVDGQRAAFTELYSQAEKSAAEAAGFPREDRRAVQAWAAVERDTSAALQRIANEPALSDFPLRDSANRLLEKARGELADASVGAEARERLIRLQAHHGDAVFFASDFTGLEPADALARTRRATAEGLALFDVREANDGPPKCDSRFFSLAETHRITERCCELLLLEAEALARPVAGERAENHRARLRLALGRLDRADRLWQAGTRIHSGLRQRADCLEGLGEIGKAAEVRRLAAATPVRLACDRFAGALEHYRREEFTEAAALLTAILREQPDHDGAEYLLAVCRLQTRQYQAAREGLSRCLQRRPEFVWPRLLRGFAAIELEQWDEARSDFDAVLRSPPDAMAAYVALVNRGVLALRRRDPKAAIIDLKAAIDRKPGAVAAYLNLALAYSQRGDVPTWQQGLLRLSPGGAFSVLAIEAHRRHARQQAVAVLDAAARRCPPVARIYRDRGRLYLALGDAKRAREDFRQAVALAVSRGLTSTLADDLIELGRLLYRDREYEESERAYRAALTVRPDRVVAWRLLAQPLLARKRYQEAGEALDRYLKTLPVVPGEGPSVEQARTLAETLKVRGLVHDEQARAYTTRGVLHLQAKDLRAALDCYTHALKWSRDLETLAFRGWIYLMFNAAELALSDFDEALQRRPRDANALIGRASARVRLGQVSDALVDVEEGLRNGNHDVRTLYNAARVHALAAPLLRPAASRAGASERRAVELLGQALKQTPEAERETFWRQYVQADRAFDPIRRTSAMSALAAAQERRQPDPR